MFGYCSLKKKGSSADYTVKQSGYVKMTVKMAPQKVGFSLQEGSATIIKKGDIKLGNTKDIYITGTAKGGKVEDVTYKVQLEKGSEAYATVTPIEGTKDGYRIEAASLKNKKKVNVKVNVVCIQNNKKGSYTLTIAP